MFQEREILDLSKCLDIFSMKALFGLPTHFYMARRHSCLGRAHTLSLLAIKHKHSLNLIGLKYAGWSPNHRLLNRRLWGQL